MKFVVPSDDNAKRLDVFLSENVKELSRSSLQKLIDSDKVTVNGQVQNARRKVKAGDKVELDYNLDKLTEIPDIELEVLYEDDDCLVVVKPKGVLTHSKGAFNPEATVATFIAPKIQKMEGDRAGIVHRLDRATSGVIICAKTEEALSWLQKQFSQRKVKKTYFAVVKGVPSSDKAVIEVPIERSSRDPKTFRPGREGKPAVTEYEVVKSGAGYSLIKLHPQTGRTHQLRVHLKYLGFPIVGDPIYDGEPHERMLLHAEKLELTLPNRERKVFEAPLPAEFHDIIQS